MDVASGFGRRTLAALLCCLVPAFAAATVRTPDVATPAPVAPVAQPGPRIALDTTLGRIVLELFPQQAPATVANFLQYAREGHYNGTVFHRTVYGVLIQGGGFTPDHQPKPERKPVANEAGNGLRNTRGTLAAARRPAVAASAGAQFFINLGDNREFDRRAPSPDAASGYAVFGRVIDGLDVADRIAALPTGARAPFAGDVPVTPVVIERTEFLPTPERTPAAPAAPAADAREPTHP